MLAADIFRQFKDAIWLAAKTAHGGGIVQGIASDRQTIDAPEREVVGLMTATAADDGLPGEGVDAVDDNPHANDGDEPVASMADVLPKLNETDVESEEHYHHGCEAEEEEDVVEALLRHLQ